MIKAIFFDVDGTLLNRRSQLEESSRVAIKKAQEKGILCGIATGRGPTTITEILEKYELDFAITYNGQYIYMKNGEVISSRQFDKKTVRFIAEYAEKHQREILFGGSDFVSGSGLLRVGNSKAMRFISPILPASISNGVKVGFQRVVRRVKKTNYPNYPQLRNPIYQVVLISPESEQQKIEANFPSCTITRSNPYSVDMIPKGGSKLVGIKIFCRHFGIDIADTMAFGDSWNDMQMIQGAGHGVAMGNAVKALKEVADFVTTSNDHDGIARAFQQFGIIEDDKLPIRDLTVEDMLVPTTDGSVDNLILGDHYFRSLDEKFNQVKYFHHTFDKTTVEVPTAYEESLASHRAGFKVEELVEFLYATANNDPHVFGRLIDSLKIDIDKAVKKIQTKQEPVDDVLVEQVDALVDLLYFTYGSFVLMGVDPHEIFNIVHAANMGKLFPDGKAHYDKYTGKILKPEGWEEKFAPELKIKESLGKQIEERIYPQRENKKRK